MIYDNIAWFSLHFYLLYLVVRPFVYLNSSLSVLIVTIPDVAFPVVTKIPGLFIKRNPAIWASPSTTITSLWVLGYLGDLPVHHSQVLMGAGLPPCLPHSQVLMGAGLSGRPPRLPHSQVFMGAGLAGSPPCLPHSQVCMGAGLAGSLPCLPHSQVFMGAGLSGGTSLSTTQSGLYRHWVNWDDTSTMATMPLPYYRTINYLTLVTFYPVRYQC